MSENTSRAVSGGIGMGSVLAMIVTYVPEQHFWWTVIHGFFGWFYLIGWGLGIWA